MSVLKHAALAGTWLALATAAIAQPPSSAQFGKTVTGATFAVAEGWTEHVMGSVVVLDPPETDTHVTIVDITRAADAKSAAAAAWELYRPRGSRPFKLLTTRPPRNGWDEQAVIDYETPPGEHLSVYSIVRRKGAAWTVVIVDGSESTIDKRAAAVDLVLASLRPAGFLRETFAGRTAHPLNPARVAPSWTLCAVQLPSSTSLA